MPTGGQQQRDGVDLVPCQGCNGRVRIKVPKTPSPPEGSPEPSPSSPNPDEAVRFKETGSRIGMTGTAYYHRAGRQPEGVSIRLLRISRSEEQSYKREVEVPSKEWVPIDGGWVTTPGLVHLFNDSDEVVTVGVLSVGPSQPPGLYQVLSTLYPGERWCMMPEVIGMFALRSRGEGARCVVTVFPS